MIMIPMRLAGGAVARVAGGLCRRSVRPGPHGAGLTQGLAWSALLLVPVEAWLTRSMLTAEPAAARACVAAAGGPRRAQVAALTAALLAGAAFGLLGVAWEVFSLGLPRLPATNAIRTGTAFAEVGGGLAAALICLLVGSAIAVFFCWARSPTLSRRRKRSSGASTS